jgi:hypothetical protein
MPLGPHVYVATSEAAALGHGCFLASQICTWLIIQLANAKTVVHLWEAPWILLFIVL